MVFSGYIHIEIFDVGGPVFLQLECVGSILSIDKETTDILSFSPLIVCNY